jgi:hypothetical protein
MWLTRPLLSLSAQIIKIGSVAALSERGALCFLSWCTAPNFCHDVAAKGFFRIPRRAEAPPNQMRATRFPSVMLRKGKNNKLVFEVPSFVRVRAKPQTAKDRLPLEERRHWEKGAEE